MTESTRSMRPSSGISALFQFRIWNLALLVVYVAIAIVDIQDQRRQEPVLIALAAAGFAAYGLIVWLGWHYIRRWEARLGSMLVAAIYVVSMGAIYLLATILYLLVENAYLAGRLSRFHLW
jgi:Kef-type K+ transport system membrane component KefB